MIRKECESQNHDDLIFIAQLTDKALGGLALSLKGPGMYQTFQLGLKVQLFYFMNRLLIPSNVDVFFKGEFE